MIKREELEVRFHRGLAASATGCAVLLMHVAPLLAAQHAGEEDMDDMEQVTIIGVQQKDTLNVPGAAHIITVEQLERFNYTDVHDILRGVPGISLQQEEGYGLRPNIGIRGSGAERSAKITLMEDGVLIAPAPYSASSAYYFPTAGRLHAIEVLKGPAAITTGPYTVGGAVNLISTPIPPESSGLARVEFGEDTTWRAHAWYGATGESFSGLVETHQYYSNGFKDIDFSRDDTGFDKSDFMAKLRWGGELKGRQQSLLLKLQLADENSKQSYLGLTDADFSANPNRRYAVSQLDDFNADHEQIVLAWGMALGDGANLSITAYHNKFARSWYKTEGYCDVSTGSLDCNSWSSAIRELNTSSQDALQKMLNGEEVPADTVIRVRNNSRKYYSEGLQARVATVFNTGTLRHNLHLGVRLHRDEEDRLQPEDYYDLDGGQLVVEPQWQRFTSNRVQKSDALAAYIHDEFAFGDWVFTPGLRYEHIDQQRNDWANSDPNRQQSRTRTRSNSTSVLLPGIGVASVLSEALTLFAGVHKGFTPPGNDPEVDEESSLNYEFGVRVQSHRQVRLNLTGFYSDYDNIIGTCTASSGGDCNVGDQFRGGAAEVIGLEADGHALLPRGFLAEFNFTYTPRARFGSSFDSNFFGTVERGDRLPEIPRKQGRLALSWQGHVESRATDAWLVMNYTDKTCVQGTRCTEHTDGLISFDLGGRMQLTQEVDLYARAYNIFDQQKIIARRPYGARANRPRVVLAGVEWRF